MSSFGMGAPGGHRVTKGRQILPRQSAAMTTRPDTAGQLWASIDIGSNSFRLELARLSGERYQRVRYIKINLLQSMPNNHS